MSPTLIVPQLMPTPMRSAGQRFFANTGSSSRSAFCMARPHSSARRAWFASRTGAPQKAMIASPMYLSTVPRLSWMQTVIFVK